MNRSAALFGLALSALVAAGASFGAWFWLGQPVAMPDVPNAHFQCLSYTPASDAGSPLTEKDGVFEVPAGLIERDMKILSKYTDCVRTYSTNGPQGDVLPAAAAVGMKVLLGIWISTDDARNQIEIDRALAMANKHPEAVRAIVVGNEVLLRREMLGDRLAATIKAVKARTNLPVAYADIYEFWRRNPQVGQAVDIALLHILPYWDDPHPVSIDDVFEKVVHPVIKNAKEIAIPGKPIIIGEIGWPSSGRTRSEAVPTLVNEARFMRTLAANADSLGVGYNLIEAIDQPWKRIPEGTVGAYWGLLDKDRQLKFPLTGPVREWTQWQTGAAVSFGAALIALLLGWRQRSRMTLVRWIGLGLAGVAVGTTAWMLPIRIEHVAAGGFAIVKAASWILAASIGTALLIGRLVMGADWPARAPASAADVVAAFRAKGRWDAATILGFLNTGILLVAATIALMLAVDGRHRDFATLAFWLPALACLIAGFVRVKDTQTGAKRYAEEAWLAMVLVISSIWSIDHYGNIEAWIWAATCWAIAAPWAGAMRDELRRLKSAATARA
jgi:glucan 1,3-beta-glucosidase